MTLKRDWEYCIALLSAAVFSGVLTAIGWQAFAHDQRGSDLLIALGLSIVTAFYVAGAIGAAIVPRVLR